MIAAIMQPYFFPYIGYFQLMHAVDTFVIYDDAQYMKGGWINRNRIRNGGTTAWLTLPVHAARLELPINQREYVLEEGVARVRGQLRAAYRKAPCRAEAGEAVDEVLGFGDANVAAFNAHLLQALARRLGIACRFLPASRLGASAGLRGQARVIDLCRRVGADHYVNPIGGTALYDAASFDAAGLRLSFLRTTVPPEALADGPQHLSILDGLMREGFAACRARLGDYVLQAA
jgi:hypothetical protein